MDFETFCRMFLRWILPPDRTEPHDSLTKKLEEIEGARKIAEAAHDRCIANNKTIYVGYCNVEYMMVLERLEEEKERAMGEYRKNT